MAVVAVKKCPFLVIVLLVHVTGSRGLVYGSLDTYRDFGLPPQIVSELVGQQQQRQQERQQLQQQQKLQQQQHARNGDCFLGRCDDVDADATLTSSTADQERDMVAQRSPVDYDQPTQKRFIFLRPSWIVEKHSNIPAAEIAKNRFTPWGGKRDDSVRFVTGEGKVERRREFHPWGGKRTSQEIYEKRDFHPWGGKRSTDDEKASLFSENV